MDKSEIKEKISHLVEKFDRLTASGQIKQYNEAQTRNEFIEPLFELLGWDMRDLENENEVTTEETVSQGRVDLAFRLNNIPVMFLEAKAAKVDLDEWKWAEQAINYSWNKGVTWAVLTDFEGIKVFNAELPPQSVQYNLFFELKYNQYLDNFDQLWLLSKESFLKNLLTEEAQKWGRVVQRKPVGKKLLESLTEWRDSLSSQFHAYTPSISVFLLDEGVQKLLDRLIFIRTTEDRKIEQNILLTIKRNWESNGRKSDLFKELNTVFKEFRNTYDSKLFEPHDFETWNTPPAETLAKIIEELYKTDEGYRYDFSAIDSDVLGGIYEQYLGHVLQKAKKEFIVEEKHAKRKSQGIFYTPSYIVNFIVQETLGKILKEKNDNEIRNIKILDPACGSGSFLLKAYGELTRYYSANDKIFEKIRILKSNIYGVDLDSQAVEIARLNLLLQTVESKDLLPDLSSNIKNGNSLISGDETTLKKYFGPKWRDQKAFNWEEEFLDVIKSGGFDVIIGNPPYVQLSQDPKFSEESKEYYLSRYESSMGRLNTFGFFIRLGIELLKHNGQLGFIIPNTILTQDYYREIRQYILNNCLITHIISFEDLPFKDAVIENIVLILKKEKDETLRNNNQVNIFKTDKLGQIIKSGNISQNKFNDSKNQSFNLNINKSNDSTKSKIESNTKPLNSFLNINQAIALKENRSKWVTSLKTEDPRLKPLLIGGKNINRYSLEWDGSYLIYNLDGIHSCKRQDIFLTDEKLFFRRVSNKLIATLDNRQFYGLHTLVVMNLKEGENHNIRYFLGLFNSKLLNYYYLNTFASNKTVFSEIGAHQVAQLPIKIINKSTETIYKEIIKFVQRILMLNIDLKSATPNTDNWEKIKSEIEKTDKKIDEEVYKLYGLTEEEIKIVEESMLKKLYG